MATWTAEELAAVGEAEELEIAPAQAGGSLRRATPIWVVRVGDDLYARSYRGQDGRWFRAAQQTHSGEIYAGGVRKHVRFVETTSPKIQEAIDEAYRTKYARYPDSYTTHMITPQAHVTTLRLEPE